MVKATSNYGKFFVPNWQRPLNRDRVERLKNLITEKNLSHSFPITVKMRSNGTMMIIDGQHRFNALKELGRPIPYIETQDHFHVSDLIEASKDTKSWSVRDVLESFSARRKPAYRFIRRCLSQYSLPDAAIRVLTSAFTTQQYNTGQLEFSNDEMSSMTEFLEFAQEFNEIADNPDSKKRAVFAALWDMYNTEGFNKTRMLRRLATYPNRFHYYSSKNESYEMLRALYNYRTKVTDQI